MSFRILAEVDDDDGSLQWFDANNGVVDRGVC